MKRSNQQIAVVSTMAVVILSMSWLRAADRMGTYVFACAQEQDLFRIVSRSVGGVFRFDTLADAVRRAPPGAGVLILANGYPDATTNIETDLLDLAATRKLRLYVEYPSSLPGLDLGQKSVHNPVERVVVASGFFGPKMEKHDLVSINGLRYLPVSVDKPHLVAARVAGFDTAVYGLPEKTQPILFTLPRRDVLVATTRLSHFVTGRFAPQDSWKNIWETVLKWLQPESEPPALQWTPVVTPTYACDQPLPEDYEMRAIRRGFAWFEKARMVIPPDTERRVLAATNTATIDALPADAPLGDGLRGSWEAVLSTIHKDGSQTLGKAQRGDCIAETAMAFAFSGALASRKRHSAIAGNLLDYYLFESDARKKERGDPNHGAYGLSAWGISSPAQYVANYAPHYEAYLWACYLWAYEQTHYELFADRAETALEMTMGQYSDGWRWTNGLAQEKARILLPLAWLVRVRDTPEHRAMLETAVDGLLALQDECGAIREELGLPEKGMYPPPRPNEAYATNEAPLIASDGDPVADLLYTNNFAFLGLHEAAAATGDAKISRAENKLAEFLTCFKIPISPSDG